MKRPEINTIKGKKKFIRDLINNIKKDALRQVARMPLYWDGIELRWYLAEEFKEATGNFREDHPRRYREYRNTRIIDGV